MKLIVDSNSKLGQISKNIYGHFSEHLGRCIYDGIYLKKGVKVPNTENMRNDIIEYLRQIHIPNLRWPGGCFADCYHWMDGIGPVAERPCIVNDTWGGVTEDNSFGTHEFLRFCELIGAEPYINANISSGSIREMSQWAEYLNASVDSPMTRLRKQNGRAEPWNVKYWGFGNEPWGDGNMRAEFYADQLRRYTTYVRNYKDRPLVRIAAGASSGDLDWTETLMKLAGKFIDAYTVHHYTIPSSNFAKKGSATKFTQEEYINTLEEANRMDEILTGHSVVMNKYDPEKRIAIFVDEWGGWYDAEPNTNPGFLYQLNTMRDAMIAAHTFAIFHRHNDRVRMANIAQLVNVLQSLFLTEGKKLVLTPTFHVFDLYKYHQDAERKESFAEENHLEGSKKLQSISHTASLKDGVLTLSLANLDNLHEANIELDVWNFSAKSVSAQVFGNGKADEGNTFRKPNTIVPRELDVIKKNGKYLFNMPACSVATIRFFSSKLK